MKPERVHAIGAEIAVGWSDGRETYYPMEVLRAVSPSAENMGERDLFGTVWGGDDRDAFPGIRVTGWEFVGGYAIRFQFSDGHRTGIYSYDYLLRLADWIESS